MGPWDEADRSDPYWNDDAFGGALLPYAEIIAVPDPAGAVFEFLYAGFDSING